MSHVVSYGCVKFDLPVCLLLGIFLCLQVEARANSEQDKMGDAWKKTWRKEKSVTHDSGLMVDGAMQGDVISKLADRQEKKRKREKGV